MRDSEVTNCARDAAQTALPAGNGGGVTWRAVVVALVLLVAFVPAGFYSELVHSATSDFSGGVPAMAPLFVLFLLAAGNPLLCRLGWKALSRRELLTIYAIVLAGGPLISHGILPWLLPYNIAQQYLARAIPEWQNTYLSQVPTWFGPTDMAAAEGYFQGHAAVPWSLWWTPLAVWLSFLSALVICTLCLMVLLRRQWITHERLSFPIAQVPLETVREGERGRGARLPRNWPFWIGFLIPCGIGLVNGLGRIFPAFPTIPISGMILMQAQATGPISGLGEIVLELTPWMIAIAYLIPKELSFSCWFFWFVRLALTVIAVAFGAAPDRPEMWYESTFPAPHHQGGGAVLALTVWGLWAARRHLARAVRLACGRRSPEAERGDQAAYRWALIGLVVSFGYLTAFCVMAGARPAVAACMIGALVAYYVMWSRLRAETGLGFLSFPFRVDEMLVVPFGSGVFRAPEVIMLYDLRWAYFPGFGQSSEVIPGNALDAFKIADAARIRFRPLLRAMSVGFVLSLLVGTYVVLTGMYHYGFQNTGANSSGWLGPQLLYIGARIFNMITSPTDFDINAVIAVAAGATVTILLSVLRLRLWWWPLHPIGYLAASCWGMHIIWMPFFVGWALKSLAVRYGGLQLYRRTVPAAIGLVVGDFVNQGMWVVVSLVVGARV